MIVELTEEEADFLADKTFWEMAYLNVDRLWSLHLPPEKRKNLEKEYSFYENLYKKLGGDLDGRRDKRDEGAPMGEHINQDRQD
jgi:hypothetical protein